VKTKQLKAARNENGESENIVAALLCIFLSASACQLAVALWLRRETEGCLCKQKICLGYSAALSGLSQRPAVAGVKAKY